MDRAKKYAAEVCEKYPFIFWAGTGGGCDCLQSKTSNGDWLVLTADSVVPESADEVECICLYKYPAADDYDGPDWDQWEVVRYEVPASQCVALMVSCHYGEVPECSMCNHTGGKVGTVCDECKRGVYENI